MRFKAFSSIAALLVTISACSSARSVDANEADFSGVVASVAAADLPGSFEVEEREYALAPTADDGVIQVAPNATPTIQTQVAGHLYLPKASGSRPLVVLLHGNHRTCGFYPAGADRDRDPRLDFDSTYTAEGRCLDGWEVAKSYQGYAYVARHLASHGFAVASIDANRGVTGGNAPVDADFGLIDARGRLVLRNLELFASWNASESAAMLDGLDMRGRFDLDQIGMMGHSRGGEGVRAAYNIYQRDLFSDFFRWKTKKPQLTFRAIFEIGAVDFGHPSENGSTTAFYDAPGLAWTALIPGCDGDVNDFQGVNSYTRMLQGAGTAPRSVVVAWGGNHNFFNTEWQTSDAEACRGAQTPMFEAPTMSSFTTSAPGPAGCDAVCWAEVQQTEKVPFGVRGSARQTDLSRILMTAFFKAHLGSGDPILGSVFDTKYDLPPRLNEIAPLWRDYVGPDSGATWAPNEIVSKVSDAVGVDVKPVEKVFAEAAEKAIEQLKASSAPETTFQAQELRTRDAVSLQWSAADPAPRASIALPGAPTDMGAKYIQLVIANMPQSQPCLVETPNASCASDGTPLDVGVRLVNADGATSDMHRLSEFGSLVPYLRSSVAGAYRFEDGGQPFVWLAMNEPVFDTIVMPLESFSLSDRPFPLSSSTQLRIDFDGTSEGTVSVRNVRLLGAIAEPVIAARH